MQSDGFSPAPVPGYSILFSAKRDWEPGIREKLCGFRLHFADFQGEDLRAYDLIVPLSLADQTHLHQLPAQTLEALPVLVPEASCIALCGDKARFHQFLLEIGLEALTPNGGMEVGYPYVLKPRVGEWGMDIHIVHGPVDELPLRGKIESGEYLRQAYVPGRQEYTAHVIMGREGIVYLQTLQFTYDGDYHIKGIGQAPCHTERVDHGHLRAVFTTILQAMGYRGICCFNYKCTESGIRIFEINPRYGGSLTPCLDEALPIYARAVGQRRSPAAPAGGARPEA